MTEETIYVALLGEGLDVWRPVKARRLSGERHLILEQEYDRDLETWASEPGAVVECRRELRNGRELVLAVKAAERKRNNSAAQARAEATATPSRERAGALGLRNLNRDD